MEYELIIEIHEYKRGSLPETEAYLAAHCESSELYMRQIMCCLACAIAIIGTNNLKVLNTFVAIVWYQGHESTCQDG